VYIILSQYFLSVDTVNKKIELEHKNSFLYNTMMWWILEIIERNRQVTNKGRWPRQQKKISHLLTIAFLNFQFIEPSIIVIKILEKRKKIKVYDFLGIQFCTSIDEWSIEKKSSKFVDWVPRQMLWLNLTLWRYFKNWEINTYDVIRTCKIRNFVKEMTVVLVVKCKNKDFEENTNEFNKWLKNLDGE